MMRDFIAERVCFYSSMFEGVSNMRQIIECAHEKGVCGVEMMNFCDELRTPDRAVAKELGKLARGYGLRLPCFSAAAYIVGEEKDGHIKNLTAYAEICAELEIPYLHHTIFPPLSAREFAGRRKSEIFEEGFESALRINEYARKLGVQTIVENQGLVFNGCENYNRLLSEAKGQLLPLFDVGNILFVDETPEELLERIAMPIAHVHIKDYKFVNDSIQDADYTTGNGTRFSDCEIGCGDLHLACVAELLKQQNYKGLYALEFSRVKNLAEVDRVLEKVSELFGE